MNKVYGLKTFKNSLAKSLYGSTVDESVGTGLCISCKEEALPKCYSNTGRREYKISGLCEKCFDTITNIRE